MSFPEINKISHVLDSIHDLTELNVFWKTPNGSPHPGIPLRQSIHCCEFCIAVQKKTVMREKCRINDTTLLTGKAKDLKHPFLNLCHAGATELIVPIFDSEHYCGSFIFGSARMPDTICPYTSLVKTYNNLPLYDEKLFNAVQSILEYLVTDIVKHYRLLKMSSLSMGNSEKIRQSQYFIMTNYHMKFTAADVAGITGLSTSRFLHLFKEKTNTTFTAYVNKIKMDEAAKMLLETDYRIIQIAYQVGFDTESYFCSLFKKHTGMPPGEYRHKFKK
jgi:AraC-like DNA-binding protein